jgi:hypothetical protein
MAHSSYRFHLHIVFPEVLFSLTRQELSALLYDPCAHNRLMVYLCSITVLVAAMHACLVLFAVLAACVCPTTRRPMTRPHLPTMRAVVVWGGLGLSLRARDADVLGHVTQE